MTFCKKVVENSLKTNAYRNCNFQFITTKLSERIALFGKVGLTGWKCPAGRDGWENRAKRRKYPISLGLEGQILQFVPGTLEHPLFTFLMTNLLLLSQKLATKLKKKNPVFLDQFRTVPSTFRLSLPKLWTKCVILFHLPISFVVNLD